MYKKPSYFEVFKHVLKSVGRQNVPIKKDVKGGKVIYKTAVSFRDSVQKVYFDTSKEVIRFTSLHNFKEETDYELKAQWVGDGKVIFKQI